MLAVNSYLGGQVVAVLDQLGVPFPGGEPQELRAAAGQWRSMAQCLEGLADDWQARITGLDAYWSGRGADACAGHLTGRVTALRAAAVEFRGLAEGLERHADEAERIAVEIVGLALEIGEQLLLGAALSVVTFGVRPEAFVLTTDADAALAVTVNVVEELGADAYIYGTASVGGADQDIVARVDGRRPPMKGETVHLKVDPEETHVFSVKTGERLTG